MSNNKTNIESLKTKVQNYTSLLEQKTGDFNKISNLKERLSNEIVNINGRIQMLNELILEEETVMGKVEEDGSITIVDEDKGKTGEKKETPTEQPETV